MLECIFMKLRKPGKADLKISEIGLGTWPLGGPAQVGKGAVGRGYVSESQATATVHEACDCGVIFFDTADIYGLGRSEEILGKAFNGRWGDNIVATKAGKIVGQDGELSTDYSPDHLRKSVEGSLRRLRKDVIDIFQLHNPPPLIACSEQVIECINRLREEGKIRYWGVSARIVSEAVQIVRHGFNGAVLQVVFNLLRQEAAEELFLLAKKSGVGIIVRVPLEYGVLTGKFNSKTTFPKNDHRHFNLEPRLEKELEYLKVFQFLKESSENSMTLAAIRFCLSFLEVVSVIPGARNPGQVRQNARASKLGPLSPDELTRVCALYKNYPGISG